MNDKYYIKSNCIDCNKSIKINKNRISIATYRCRKCYRRWYGDRLGSINVARANRTDDKYFKGEIICDEIVNIIMYSYYMDCY